MLFTRKSHWVLAGLLLLQAAVAGVSVAQDKANIRPQQARAVAADDLPDEQVLDVNSLTMWVENDGFFNWLDNGGVVNGTYPKGTASPIFAQGVVWGGIVRDGKTPTVRVNGSVYSNGLDAGRILGTPGNVTGPDDPTSDKYHVWRVHRNWRTLDYNQAAGYWFGVPASSVSEEQRTQLRSWYQYDWENWPADIGAPYDERNGQPGYQPASDANGNGSYEPEEGDIPGYPGADQTVWLVANDLEASAESYGSPAIGIEYQLTIWGYDFPSSSPLGNLAFMQARLIYKGTPTTPAGSRIDSMHVVMWADPDVGSAGDDYAGSDTTLSLGYAYNANTRDTDYDNFGLAPPAVGWDFLQGPVNQAGDTLGMTAFVYFAAGSDISDPDELEYSGTLQWFNLMRGLKPRPEYPSGEPFVDPITGEQTVFTLAGDPVSGGGWVDGIELPPGDRRVVLASGPFTMQLGDTADVVVGVIGGLGTSNLSSITVLKYHDQFAQFAYDNDFQLPSAPPVPEVSVSELDRQVVLNWGSNLEQVARTETWDSRGFEFEGYNVYQLPAPNAPLASGVKIATFDKVNLASTIIDQVIDQQSGFVIRRPVQTGPNEGLQRYLVVSQDRIRNQPLANGVEYYYALTAYSFSPEAGEDAPFRQLESTPTILTVVPQPERPGVTEAPAPEESIDLTHPAGTSTAGIDVQIVDATKIQSGNYELRFAYYNPYTGQAQTELAAGDTLTSIPDDFFEYHEYYKGDAEHAGHALEVGDPFPLRWALFRGGQQVSGWLPQLDPAADIPPSAAPIIEGLQIYVPLVIAGIADWHVTGTRWVSWTNWGGDGFNGGASIGSQFLGSTLPDDELVPVVLEFEEAADTLDGWASRGTVFVRANSYAVAGTGHLPFAAYELDASGNKVRQLNVSFVEVDDDCGNLRWDMGMLTGRAECSDLGGREYILVHKSDYNEGADYTEAADRYEDVLYGVWPAVRGTHPFGEADFTLSFEPAIATTVADQFTFEVDAPQTGNQDLLAQSVEEINVFPNPYFGFSRLETNRYQKFVTFTHLPEKATIRIFNLAGIAVRIIEHEGTSQFEQWDLTNQDGIPVASGIYLVHVETDHGEKVLKLALVQEEQILQRY